MTAGNAEASTLQMHKGLSLENGSEDISLGERPMASHDHSGHACPVPEDEGTSSVGADDAGRVMGGDMLPIHAVRSTPRETEDRAPCRRGAGHRRVDSVGLVEVAVESL